MQWCSSLTCCWRLTEKVRHQRPTNDLQFIICFNRKLHARIAVDAQKLWATRDPFTRIDAKSHGDFRSRSLAMRPSDTCWRRNLSASDEIASRIHWERGWLEQGRWMLGNLSPLSADGELWMFQGTLLRKAAKVRRETFVLHFLCELRHESWLNES